jgi:hypothetical protein
MNFKLSARGNIPILACVIKTEIHTAEEFEKALISRLKPARQGS